MNDHTNSAGAQAGEDFSERSQPAAALRPLRHQPLRRPADKPAAAGHEPVVFGGGIAGFLHAFRRRWFLATSLGLIAGATAAVVVWQCAPINYTSSAVIKIAAIGQELVPSADKSSTSFDLYKGTQTQLITSELVLTAALRDPNVAALEIVKREEDPIRWLSRTIQIEAPGNAELLRISLTTSDREGGATILQAVTAAYLKDVVGKENTDRSVRREKLEAAYSQQEIDLRGKRTELIKLAEQIGSGDKGALSLKEQFALQQYGESRTELNRLRAEIKRIGYALADNDARRAAVKAGRAKPATAAEIDNAVNNDQESMRLQQALAALDDEMSDSKSVLKEGGNLAKSLSERYLRIRKSLDDQLAARRTQLAGHLATVKSGDTDSLEDERQQLQSQAARLAQEEQLAAKEVEAQRIQTDQIGKSSINVEMMRKEVDEMEKTFSLLADEREHARFDQYAQDRISLVQPASPPAAPDKSSRLQNAISAGLFGFLAPVGLLLWWDVRARRINSVLDISRGLGLRVIGSVPHIADSTTSRLRPNSRRLRQTQICLDHSIDGIAAKLCLRRDAHNARVVLVSSASRGEGKSTLSIQLAKRLARTGADTLLVDFDLRKPVLHHVFDAPRGPGLSEFLRGESELDPIVRRTDFDNLSILTAGTPFSNSLGTLANGVTRSLFEKVRAKYEFVVVDGSPILPVVDSLLASQHVDAVVLAIRRDVSQIARVQSACDQLAQFGVEEFVAVLTGSNEDLFYYDGDREPVTQAGDEGPKPR